MASIESQRDWFASLAAGFASLHRQESPTGRYLGHVEDLCIAWGRAKREADPEGTAWPDAEFLPQWPTIWRRHLEGWLTEHGQHIEEAG